MHLIHRGIVSNKYHENLLKSFEQSFKKGFGIETDIHATKDNEFICFHDFTLTRIFKRKESVKNLSYLKIKNISEKQKKPVPLLKELLKSSKNRYFLFIEIKPTFSIKQLKKLLNETKKYKNAFCAVRPPGHHAEKNKAMGFCIYNNVAVGANYLIEKFGYKKEICFEFYIFLHFFYSHNRYGLNLFIIHDSPILLQHFFRI